MPLVTSPPGSRHSLGSWSWTKGSVSSGRQTLMALLPRAALGRAKEKRHNWPQPLRSLQVVWPDREGWVPGHLPRWPQETKPCNRWSKDAGVRTSLLDTMLLFCTSFLKFLLILPLLKCLFFSPLFHCYIKYVLLIFFYKILELLSSFLFKVTPL